MIHFYGSTEKLDKLVSSKHNQLGALLADVYNEGYADGATEQTQAIELMFNKAKGWVEQKLPLDSIPEKNPFFDILLLYETLRLQEDGKEVD